MQESRGFFRLEAPAGGLDRLREVLRQREREDRGLSLLPWATAAVMLATIGGAAWMRGDAADRIVAAVRSQEAETWAQLPGPAEGAKIYVARPVAPVP